MAVGKRAHGLTIFHIKTNRAILIRRSKQQGFHFAKETDATQKWGASAGVNRTSAGAIRLTTSVMNGVIRATQNRQAPTA